MSIIHDALKKVQQKLNIKPDEPPVIPPVNNQNAPGYIYDTPPALETLPPASQQAADQKISVQYKIKSILALLCACLITAASVYYIWQQVQHNMPQVQTFAQKSFFQLIHKEPPVPDFKAKKPEDLKPLAQLTINPSAAKPSNSTVPLASVTLNIHGIMANASGNLVLINDQVYQEGDEVDGAKIVKINLNSIKVINNGIEQTIFVGK